MTTKVAQVPLPASRGRRFLFVLFAVLLGTAAGLMLTESGLRYYVKYVQSQEQIDPGFLIFDSQLGWQMASNWNGQHRHYDFDVRYTTNSLGLRGPWPEPVSQEPQTRPRYALVGDSFTFGLGVNDNETFVQRLNIADPSAVYLNAGIAGFSTDQEYLFLRKQLPGWKLTGLVLVVYLANDLIDNTLRYPLQANMAKPLFVLDSGELRLANVPVPLQLKPEGERDRTLASLVLGEEEARVQETSWRNHWQLARILGLADTVNNQGLEAMSRRLTYPIDLFVRLIAEIHRLCEESHVSLSLILMPGRSYVELPNGLSAAFQEFLRKEILARRDEFGVPILDLATPLSEKHGKSGIRLFHPNEGHLTAAGHQAVADMLRGWLKSH